MFKSMETGSQKTPEQVRKEYEERNAKIAKEKEIDVYDIIRHDADAENWAREGKGQRGWRPDLKEKLANSDLIMEYPEDESEILKGDIDGKNIEIQVTFGHRTHSSYIDKVLKSTMDGEPLDENEAKTIFNKYKDIARGRTNKIDNLAWENKIQKEDAEKLKDVREHLDTKE